MIRPLRPGDCKELAALYRANRDFLAAFEPIRPPEFFTTGGQRERLRRQLDGGTHPFYSLGENQDHLAAILITELGTTGSGPV